MLTIVRATIKCFRAIIDDSKILRNFAFVGAVRSIFQSYSLLTSLSCYHPNINFTVEVNPSKFLDSNIKIVDGKVETSVCRKPNKMPVHWTSKVPKRYKRNTINGALNRSYQISMNFDYEKKIIREKYHLAGFPTRFVNNVIQQFTKN